MPTDTPPPQTARSGRQVLHYTGYDSERGGVMAALRALAPALAGINLIGVGPHFVAPPGFPLAPVVCPKIEAEKISLAAVRQAGRTAWQVRTWLRADATRIYHGHSRAGLLVALWLRLLGETRVLATVRCLGRQRWLYRLARRVLGDRLYFLGPAMQRYYGLAVDDAQWLPDCVPAAAIAPPAIRPRGGETVFGCAGGLVPVKQWETVMHALSRLPGALAVRVEHAGSENGTPASAAYAEELRRLAATLQLGGRWTWTGEQAAMESFFARIDCLVVASPWEASSMAALEAIAAGVPVLAPAAGGTADLIQHCRGGWTFSAEPDQVAALAARMQALADGRELRAWRRDEAGLADFEAGAIAARHERVYQALLLA